MVRANRPSGKVLSYVELQPKGAYYTRPMHIIVTYSGYRIPSVLIDNRSTLNVCSYSTAIALGYGQTDLTPSLQTVRAYNSTRKDMIGTLTLDIMIGPATFFVLFQVMKISASFNMLLGRSWIQAASVIPSSLHQKVKFKHEDQIVTISISGSANPPIEPILEISPGLELADFTRFSFEEGQILELGDIMDDRVPAEIAPHGAQSQLRMMLLMQHLPSMGLGLRQYGLASLTIPQEEDVHIAYGLGFTPNP